MLRPAEQTVFKGSHARTILLIGDDLILSCVIRTKKGGGSFIIPIYSSRDKHMARNKCQEYGVIKGKE